MNSQYVNRIIRACKLDVSLYEEVEADKSATFQAAGVVVLSSLAAGVGALSLGAFNFLMAPLLSLVSWYVWAYLIYFLKELYVILFYPTNFQSKNLNFFLKVFVNSLLAHNQ